MNLHPRIIEIITIGIICVCLSYSIQAGVTGKISGVVTDKKTGEPLIGVNLTLEGTYLGTATDEDGTYFLLQVPPGKYVLVATYIGYANMRFTNLQVSVDLTTRVDIEMEEQAVELGEAIVVTAERPVIQKDITSSTQFVGLEELEQLPIRDAKEGLFLQTGVLFEPLPVVGGLGGSGRGEPRYAIRGGAQDEVKWYLDGIRTASLIEGRADIGGSFTNVNLNSIEEMQVITGGYTAEYGEAQSGIVNIITKEAYNQFHGSIEYLHGFKGQRHFGNYLYDRNTQKEFIDNTLPDGTLDPNWWTEYRQRQVYDYTDIPDHTVYLGFGGPLFNIQGRRSTFFVSSQLRRLAYTTPHPRDSRDLKNLFVNTVFYPTSTSKLRLSGMYNQEIHTTLQENGDFTNQSKYYRGWGSILKIMNTMLAAHWNQTLNSRLYYNLKLSYYLLEFKEEPSDFIEFGESENPTLFEFQRYNGYPGEPFDAWAPTILNHSKVGDISLVGSLNWQFDSANMLQTGFEFRYNIYDEIQSERYASLANPDSFPDAYLNRGLHEKFNPLQVAFYVQDKMEFSAMILNLGVRYDYFNPKRDWFVPINPEHDHLNLFNLARDPEYDASLDPDGDQIDSNGHIKYAFSNVLALPREKVRSYHMVSPRLGVSFPVTSETLLHFNYGHFYQMPPLDRMFEFAFLRPSYVARAYWEAAKSGEPVNHVPSTQPGNIERVVFLTLEPLKPEKTIQFEVGVKHNFSNFAVLDITAYYKDVFNQTQSRVGLFDRFIYGYDPDWGDVTPNLFYVSNFPGDYGDARGFEITFRTLFSRTFSLDINYIFSRSVSGRGSPDRIDIDVNGEATYSYSVQTPSERIFSRPHVLRANLYLRYPHNPKESIFSNILKGSSVSILYKLVSGQTFTYLTLDDPPDLRDNYRYPSIQTVDLLLDKAFNFWKTRFSVYLRVTNLLNTKNLRSYGDPLFDADATQNYVENGEITMIDGGGYDISWQTYYEPRRFYLGAKFSF
jgi:outer membrane receptor protein involved in Fe transport